MTLDSLSQELAAAIAHTLGRVVHPTDRLFWPFLLSSVVIAVALGLARRQSLRSALRLDVFVHPSAQMDYRLLVANTLTKSLLFSSWIVSVLAVVAAVHGTLVGVFGELRIESMASWQITVLYTLVLFVAHDASRFLLHRGMHAIPLLWQFHQVHHSAEVLTPATVHRVHPVESFLYASRSALVTGLITGVFFFLFRGSASQAELFGVNAIGVSLNLLGANLRHSHVWLSFGALEKFLMSPAQHQMHHGRDATKGAANYGAFLAVWDRLANSWRPAMAEAQPQAFGLDDANHRSDSLLSAYFGPFAAGARELAIPLAQGLPRPATSLLALSAMQCTPTDDGANNAPDADYSDFDRAGLVKNLSENLVVPRYEDVAAKTGALADAVDTYCAAIGGESEAETRAAAQAAFSATFTSWQAAELSIIGPASADDLGLRDAIYSWPVSSPCAVDQAVMSLHNDSASFDISAQLGNRRGLDSLEYLLYTEVEASQCAAIGGVYPEGWDALPTDTKWSARCNYAALAIDDVGAQVDALLSAWNSADGYLATLNAPGTGRLTVENSHLAVNRLFDGLFYLYEFTKEAKLGAVSGSADAVGCTGGGAACPEVLESKYAHLSKEAIRANLDAFAELYLGGDALGFDDFLVAKGATELDTRMQEAIAAANAALDAIELPLDQALVSELEAVKAADAAVQKITQPLKTEVPLILELDVPQSSDGDAD